jgi:hypothetical protein
MEKSESEQRLDEANTSATSTGMMHEEIAWQMVNNLISVVGHRLTVTGMELAATTFLLGTLLTGTIVQEDSKASISRILPNEGVVSVWHVILWILVLAALFSWGIAFFFFLISALRYISLQRGIHIRLSELLRMNTADERTAHLVGLYTYGRPRLLDETRFGTASSMSLLCGLPPAIGILAVYVYLVI